MTEWDKEREKSEFDQAARLFKPLAGVIKDRFTSASMPDDLSDPLAVVEKVSVLNFLGGKKYGLYLISFICS